MGTENLHAYIEKPTHPKRVTAWCGFWSRGIIGPFFFENEQGEAVTVNFDRYRATLAEFLFSKIEEEDIGNIWFQQDGPTCHTAEATLDVLRPVFEDRIIIFSDEAHFDLGGYLNKQNCRIWAQKTRMHTLKSRRTQNESLFLMRILVQRSSKNEQGEAVTVNGDCYRVILNKASLSGPAIDLQKMQIFTKKKNHLFR